MERLVVLSFAIWRVEQDYHSNFQHDDLYLILIEFDLKKGYNWVEKVMSGYYQSEKLKSEQGCMVEVKRSCIWMKLTWVDA